MNDINQPRQTRRIRSFFIKDILEHRSRGEERENPAPWRTSSEEAVVQTSNPSTFSVEHILSNNGERLDPCSSGCCDCPSTLYPAYKSTAIATPFYHPYLYTYYRQQAAWRQSLKEGVAYVDPQNAALYSQVKQRKPRRPWTRAVFSNLQRKGLEKRFQVQKYLTKGDRHQLASMLGLSDNQVKVWFQNRRMKWRQEEHTGEESAEKLPEKSEFQTSTVASSSKSDVATLSRKE